MEVFFTLTILYIFGSVGGWFLELFYRRYFSTKKWINPGFLNGPSIPLYGLGISALFLMVHYLRFDKWFNFPYWANAIIVIILMGIIVTLLEYVAGIIFIKGMGIKLWDYSDRKFNLQGIICPTFSLYWTIGCAAFFFALGNPCEMLLGWVKSTGMYAQGLIFILGMFYGVLLADFIVSFHLARKIRKFAKKHKIIVRFESLKSSAIDSIKQTGSLINPIKIGNALRDHLANGIKSLFDDEEETEEITTRRRKIAEPIKEKVRKVKAKRATRKDS